jgi:hypothetical protein
MFLAGCRFPEPIKDFTSLCSKREGTRRCAKPQFSWTLLASRMKGMAQNSAVLPSGLRLDGLKLDDDNVLRIQFIVVACKHSAVPAGYSVK